MLIRTMTLPKPTLEDIEIHLLLEGVYQYYGYDFRDYALSSLKRRIQSFMQLQGLANVSALQERLLHNRAYLEHLQKPSCPLLANLSLYSHLARWMFYG
jgi:chemotaxis protein methyltransferase CheR